VGSKTRRPSVSIVFAFFLFFDFGFWLPASLSSFFLLAFSVSLFSLGSAPACTCRGAAGPVRLYIVLVLLIILIYTAHTATATKL